jgi:hypothetical protein
MRTGSRVLLKRRFCGKPVTRLRQQENSFGAGPFFDLEGAFVFHERNENSSGGKSLVACSVRELPHELYEGGTGCQNGQNPLGFAEHGVTSKMGDAQPKHGRLMKISKPKFAGAGVLVSFLELAAQFDHPRDDVLYPLLADIRLPQFEAVLPQQAEEFEFGDGDRAFDVPRIRCCHKSPRPAWGPAHSANFGRGWQDGGATRA